MAGFFADEAFTAKELVLQNLSNLSPDSAGFGKKATGFLARVQYYGDDLRVSSSA